MITKSPDVIIAQTPQRWCMIAKYPALDPCCLPARARRNFHRLWARHPQIAQKLGLSATSAYTP
jgi:hypothetical protein